ncbi:unnamed protein product [Phytophthora fragariaefolia]|uniref:Unnamed protein product n=1 Tax=Phytophthora fragariaefolia TaxID=1490495 RepID=A0A9W6WWM8_9STRA|nr:unnamed protein product [Phytophthora fragariaefolia]
MIYNNGYSRIPVWNKDPNDIVGIIFTKDLIYVDPNQDVPLIAFARVFAVAAHRIWLDAQLGEILSVFKMGGTHMALVYDVNNSGPQGDPFYELKGLVTLEDIVEEILQSKIIDETDSPEARKERQNCTDQIGADTVHLPPLSLLRRRPSPIGNQDEFWHWTSSSEFKYSILIEQCDGVRIHPTSAHNQEPDVHRCIIVVWGRGPQYTIILSIELGRTSLRQAMVSAGAFNPVYNMYYFRRRSDGDNNDTEVQRYCGGATGNCAMVITFRANIFPRLYEWNHRYSHHSNYSTLICLLCAAHAATAFEDRIWIVGGVSASYYTKRLEYTTTRSDVVSSPDGIEWTEVLEEAPFRRRYGHSLITFTDPTDNVERLTLLGGFSPEPATDIWMSSDGVSWTETTATVPWAGRGYHCSVVFNSKLWVLGGSPINNEVWSTPSILKGPWKQQNGVPWSPRAAHACAAHETMDATVGDSSREEFLFLLGGWRDTSLRDVWRMDSSGEWEMLVESAPWEPRAWFSVVSFDSRTNGDVQLGPRLWVIGGGIVGNGIEKMYPFSDVWYSRDGLEWVEASSNSSGISTAEWSMLAQSNEEVCMGKWGHTVVPFYRTVGRACFPESAPIIVAGGKTKRLGDVKIGDSVLALDAAGELVYSTVYYIPHESLVGSATEFISVEYEGLAHKQGNVRVRADQIHGRGVCMVITDQPSSESYALLLKCVTCDGHM